MSGTRIHRRARLALMGCLALALAGTPLPTTAAAAPALDWHRCTQAELKGLDCADFTVPRDYDDPSKGTFDLAVVRATSTGSAGKRIGTMFFNPGGPGVASLPLAQVVTRAIPAHVRERFDIVLWDPRGVGASAGLEECTGGTYALPDTGPVDWVAVADEMRASQTAANAACTARYPDVVPYISTNATVRDLDALRAAVGDQRLTYWGTSYGTRIGYVYAHAYPDRVRAMLLTSPISPQATWTTFAAGAATAPDTALSFAFEAFPGLRTSYLRSARTLNDRTLALPSGTRFTRWMFRGQLSPMSVSESSYVAMADYIRTVDIALHGTGAKRAAALKALDRITEPMTRFPILGGATAFIGCSDYADRPTPAQQVELSARIRGEAPIVGWASSMGLYYCEGIDVAPNPVPTFFTNWSTPMLIMGSTRDSLTPYGWAVDMARTFRNSRVVSFVSSTHTPFLAGSDCVDRYGIDYLITLKRPPIDQACPATLSDRIKEGSTRGDGR